jgi:trimeric autotransporter adhesin
MDMYRKLLQVSKTVVSLSFLAIGSFIAEFPLAAQTHTPVQPRVTQAIDPNTVVALRGNTHPLAQSKFDTGVAAGSLPADRLLLILKRSAQQEADLRQYLASVQDKDSPNYHKFLTPEQFGQLYGPADSDIAAVTGWLQGQGFLVNKVSKGRTTVEFSGNSGQVQSAFRTAIHSYVIKGEPHYANVSDPQIPAALAPVVGGIVGLNNFRPKPYTTLGPTGKYDPGTKIFQPLFKEPSGSSTFLYVGPADAATIYNSPNQRLNNNFQSSGGSTTYDGTGVTIGVVGDSNINTADNDNYRKLFGLPANTPTVVVDGQDPGITADSDEALLDTQIAGGLAPGAAVKLYIASDTTLQAGIFLAIIRAINDNAVDILNVSFGNCEFNLGGNNQTLSNFWEQAAAQGITVTVATGDYGSAACDVPSTETTATRGLAVNGFASTPFNVAVGGTDFGLNATNFSTYVGTTNSPLYGSNSTVIAPIDPTTGTVVPENPWNESTNPNTATANNVAIKDSTTGATNIVAAGGGASNCSTVVTDSTGASVSCTSGWPKPSWQLGLQTTQQPLNNATIDNVRDIPDVSLFAAKGIPSAAAWAVCRDSDCILDSNGQPSATTTVQGLGGTSAASAAFAGIFAIVSQEEGIRLNLGGPVRLGQANNVLYPLAALRTGVYHDVTVGDISVPCTGGTADCGANGFLKGYDAGLGYDLATGLGSVDITALTTHWHEILFTPTTTTFTLNGGTSLVTIQHGTPVTANTSVVATPPATGIPTGDVLVMINSAPLNGGEGVLRLDPTTAIGSGTISSLPGGSYQVTGRYSGDASFATSTSTPTIDVTVTPEPSVANFAVFVNGVSTPITSGGSYPYGTRISAEVRPAGTSAAANIQNGVATGTAIFTDNATTATRNLNSKGIAEYDTNTAAIGLHTFSAAYSGDASFGPNTGGPITLTIGQPATTTTTVSSSLSSVPGNTSFALTAAIATPSYGAGPTGTVTFFAGTTQVGTNSVTPVDGSPTSKFTASGYATATIQASMLAGGPNNITAVYTSDNANYTGSTSVAITVTVTATFTSGASAANPAAVAAGSSTSSTITITPFGGFNGAITFTCTVQGRNAGDVHVPTCANPASVTIPTGSTATATTTATVSTTAPVTTTAALRYRDGRPNNDRWLAVGGGAVLACVVFFGIPARRRSWRAMLGMFVFLAALTFSGCGGGGGNSGGGGTTTTPGTSADTYTVTVTAADSTGAISKTTTFTFTVK